MSNVSKAYAMINGQKVSAVYDEETGLWSVEMTAPAVSSWNLPDHVYTVSLHAEDEAGNVASMTSDDATYGSQLKIRVLETTKPVAIITKPTSGSIFGTDTVDVELRVSDEGDSGINESSIVFKVNNLNKSSELTWIKDPDAESDVRSATYTAVDLSDGTNSLSLTVTDNDGNVSETANVTIVISTAAPTLEITSPMEGIITNGDTVTISGSSGTGTAGVSISSITVNGVPVIIESDGTFTYDYTLSEGENVITIVATDTVGNSTQVVRHVTLDTKAPVITDVVTDALTVNASGMIRITFKVSDAPVADEP